MATHERFEDPTRCTRSSQRGEANASRAQGYSAASVDDICRTAEPSNGAFFAHFKSKEDLALAAATPFSQMAERLFSAAPYRRHAAPLDRPLGYVDLRSALSAGHWQISPACSAPWCGRPTRRIRRSAMPVTPTCGGMRPRSPRTSRRRKPSTRPRRPGGAEGLALYLQPVLQGASVLAKAKGDVARDGLAHLRGYLTHPFHRPTSKEER
jgi:TetR/AcrR family transcriptional regulator, transcriptional repressor for nem operon